MPNSTDVKRICTFMPKVELHAHLNGCISKEMLEEISQSSCNPRDPTLNQHSKSTQVCPLFSISDNFKASSATDSCCNRPTTNDAKTLELEPLNLSQCFQSFAKIHKWITTPEILHWVTKRVIEEFHLDNVVYLELRTTPKVMHEIRSKDAYTESVIQAILDCRMKIPMIVKLLISVDRKLSVEEAEENVELAIKWKSRFPDIVVGTDLSGDPTKGTFNSLLPSLIKARENGLKLSLHLPEVVNVDEAREMLQFHPDRAGHALYIHPLLAGKKELWELLKEKEIPVEVCLTSNIVTKGVESLMYHHVQHLYEEGMPLVICTDDPGVFCTSLSNEYSMLTKVLHLAEADGVRLRNISLKSPDYLFGTVDEKTKIKAIISTWWDEDFPKLVSSFRQHNTNSKGSDNIHAIN